jgi:pilus assembly protein FimV
VPKAPAEAPAAKGAPPELQRALDEVEQYVSLGFVDDAKDALGDIVARFPNHPAVAAKMAELGLEIDAPAPAPAPKASARPAAAPARPAPPPPPAPRAPAPAPAPPEDEFASLLGEAPEEPEPPPAPAAAADDPFGDLGLEEAPSAAEADDNPFGEPAAFVDEVPSFGEPAEDEPIAPEPPIAEEGGMDLGAQLDGLFETQAAVEERPSDGLETDLGDAGLADIFKEFKKGVDKQLGKEDHDTRYNLGIAYKEMGLVDEAIAEFQLAARDEARLLECSSMLGICFLEKGMAKLAVKWFEKGLTAPDRTEEEYQGLRYDLATALEAAGEADRALQLYTDLYGQDANFRDVASKVRELRAALR